MSPSIEVLDHGRALRLDYAALLAYHGGGALAGAAIGFQAMACAGAVLSRDRLWDRKDLHVRSWHNGPGVRDAIEFVTRALTRGRFELCRDAGPTHCGNPAAFRFELGDGRRSVELRLASGVVDPRFFELADLATRSPAEDAELERLKARVAGELIGRPWAELFVWSERTGSPR